MGATRMGPLYDCCRVPTAGWWTESEYGQFVEAYGYDVTSWTDGFPILRAVHEIKMTTWLMQNVNESPEIAKEYEKRMRTIRGQAADPEGWRPFKEHR